MSYPKTQTVGSAGGTIDCGDNFKVVIPAGALSRSVEFTINYYTDSNNIPGGYTQISYKREIRPQGTSFSDDVLVYVPYDKTSPSDYTDVVVGFVDPLGWYPKPTNPSSNRAVATITDLNKTMIVALEPE